MKTISLFYFALVYASALNIPKVTLPPKVPLVPFVNIDKKPPTNSNTSVTEEQTQNPNEVIDYQQPENETALLEKEENGFCHDGLGCFPNKFPWLSVLRPFPLPKRPEEIDTKIYLYTTTKPKERYTVTLWKDISIENSDYDPKRPYTAFITHGFASSGNVSWVEEMKDAYLKRRDANVFLVDWGKGASTFNYLQVAANTRVVGAELKRFGEYLVSKMGQDPEKIHLIGHSLGSHISAYMAKGVPGVGQLTALDPAQPGFEYCSAEVRLKKGDAKFIDVIHTNTRPTIPLLGFGLTLPTGDNDYYMNGGLIQPGCKLPPVDQVKGSIKGIADLAKYPVEVISEWVACSHGRSYLYYTEALLNDYCNFWGRSAGLLTTAADIASLGFTEKVLSRFTECKIDTCSPIGLESQEYPARGVFLLPTHAYTPYCQSDPKITESMKKQRTAREDNLKNGVTEKSIKLPIPIRIGEKVADKLI